MISKSLNSREQVKKLIQTGKADKILKGELVIDNEIVKSSLGCEYVGFEEKKCFVESLGLDLITVSPHSMDEYQIKNFKTEDYPMLDLRNWITRTKYFTFAIIDGAFEQGIQTWGLEKFFHLVKERSSSLEEWIQTIEKINLNLIRKLAAEGTDGIIIADDIAYAGGLIASPQSFRNYFIPSLVHQVEEIKRNGLIAFYHSDGNYQKVLQDIVKAGFDGLHCIDRNSKMDISQLQKEVGPNICLWGHLDVQDLEEVAHNPNQLKQKKQWIKELASEHRLLLGTSSGLFQGINIQGLHALYQI
ncbi:uroporphyrinogen decarboxylase family protein [Desulfitobacterium sp. Sab5]|uniref:uroporphyrinogen decarboxylase family protein n=1 Tax=Desulfitobacterium nosdiversum TaxID=3375356 RepID=UPI003CE70D3B